MAVKLKRECNGQEIENAIVQPDLGKADTYLIKASLKTVALNK